MKDDVDLVKRESGGGYLKNRQILDEKRVSLNDRYDNKNNSFGILAIIASILIIFFHSYALFYGPVPGKTDVISKFLAPENLGNVVVAMFFIISGFMITFSIQRSKNVFNYLKKRVLKIFPTLACCLIFSALVFAPIVTNISILDYVKMPSVYMKYIVDNLLLWKNTVYLIPNVLLNNPYPLTINGSIWTLKHQFLMYLLIIPVYYFCLKKDDRKKYFNFLFGILFLLTAISFSGKYDTIFQLISDKWGVRYNIGVFTESKQLIKLLYYFFAGVFMNVNREKILYSKTYIILGLISVFLGRNVSFLTNVIAMILVPYFTMYIGSYKMKKTIKIPDISYQIYIFAFPIQQLIIYYLNNKVNFTVYTLISILVTIIIGIIAYYVIEYPTKRLK